MIKYNLSEETLGYSTSPDPSNTDKRLLVAGSKNVQIDYQKKIQTRGGTTRLGVANSNLTENRNAWTWNSSTGLDLPQRFYDQYLEVYLTTIDGLIINNWTQVRAGWNTTEKLRAALWWDSTEQLDLQIMVINDANLYEWSGGIAVVASVLGTTVTKAGTNTFAQNRFYTTRNKTFLCVRTGTEYTYSGGETTLTLTGITDTTGLVAGDILVQKTVLQANKPSSNHPNYTIFSFENQIVLGSKTNQEVYISKNTVYTDFSFSAPRVAGEGAKLTLDATNRAINSLGKYLIIFSGKNYLYKCEYNSITVGSTLAETLQVKRLDVGVNRGALNHESVVTMGNSLAYLTNEVSLRVIDDPENLTGIDPKTFSNPIKPDFDNETWDETQTYGTWYKNILFYTSGATSTMYMLNFIEDADGKLLRFWNPPQIIPVGPMSIIDSGNGPFLHGHSNSVPETYLLFDGQSDGQYQDMDVNDKLPIDANASFAYDNFGDPSVLKKFDEYYVGGDITTNTTDLILTLNYNYGGATQQIQKIINGSDEGILEGLAAYGSLGQKSLATNPLGSLLNPPADARKFRVTFEIALEDFHEIQDVYSSNEVDRYWAITIRGSNGVLSPRRDTSIRR